MKEDFLHYLWQFKKFDFLHAETTNGEPLQFFQTGTHNQHNSGPDFFNAKLKIGDQTWAGNVEIHLKSSDWYAHHHETDSAYDNVILHVVWEHDVEVCRKDNSPIPTLTLKTLVHKNALRNYRELLGVHQRKWINCEADFPDFPDFEIENWLERLFIERLERKAKDIHRILEDTTKDWEGTLFRLLAKNFGLNVNGDAFLSMARSIPFSKLRKIRKVSQMEALFFGQIGALDKPGNQPYYQQLQQEYRYLKQKLKLSRKGVLPVSYFRLRPQNFPTIRLSQLAVLCSADKRLFYDLIETDDLKKIKARFSVETSPFWKTHYTFEKESRPKRKRLSKNFVDLLVINTIVPLKFCYFKEKGKLDFEKLYSLMRELPAEKNRIVKGFDNLRPGTAEHALDSQALIQLKREYCDKNRCLHCNLGLKLLQKPLN